MKFAKLRTVEEKTEADHSLEARFHLKFPCNGLGMEPGKLFGRFSTLPGSCRPAT